MPRWARCNAHLEPASDCPEDLAFYDDTGTFICWSREKYRRKNNDLRTGHIRFHQRPAACNDFQFLDIADFARLFTLNSTLATPVTRVTVNRSQTSQQQREPHVRACTDICWKKPEVRVWEFDQHTKATSVCIRARPWRLPSSTVVCFWAIQLRAAKFYTASFYNTSLLRLQKVSFTPRIGLFCFWSITWCTTKFISYIAILLFLFLFPF